LAIFSLAGLVENAQAKPLPIRSAVPVMQGASDGAAIFNEKCAPCHTIGGGKLIGPDLKDVTKTRDAAWLERFISNPGGMLDSDPIAQQLLKEYNNVRMPNLGLPADEVGKIIVYLENPGAISPGQAAPSSMPGAGDPSAGRMVFTGLAALANGGPACINCHTVSGVGELGGGQLGPNLTHVVQRLGEPGLAAGLKNIAFPTMIGPYKNRLLTEKEQADLIAFLKDADRQQAPVPVSNAGTLTGNSWAFLGIASVVAMALYGLLFLLRPRRQQGTSSELPVRKS
jgi:cytochrome c2